jgi:hypothetical protein
MILLRLFLRCMRVIHTCNNFFGGKVHSEEFMAGFLGKLQDCYFSGSEPKATSPPNHAPIWHHLEDVDFIFQGAGTPYSSVPRSAQRFQRNFEAKRDKAFASHACIKRSGPSAQQEGFSVETE